MTARNLCRQYRPNLQQCCTASDDAVQCLKITLESKTRIRRLLQETAIYRFDVREATALSRLPLASVHTFGSQGLIK